MLNTTVITDRLADALIERLAVLLPADVTLEHPIGSPTIAMTRPGQFSAVGPLLFLRLPIPRRITLTQATTATLEAVQQFAQESGGAPWPPAPHWYSSGPPKPYAKIKRGQLLLGFGDADAPIVALVPITLSDLTG